MVFENIQEDPDICSNCFRRTHDRFERNYRVEVVKEDGESKLWFAEVDGFSDSVFRREKNTTRIPENGGYRGMITICKCGFRYVPSHILDEKDDWKNRPLNKSTFFDYAENIEERMVENGVDFDKETYYSTLDRLKSDPEKQFKDDSLFEKACKKASTISTIRNSQASD